MPYRRVGVLPEELQHKDLEVPLLALLRELLPCSPHLDRQLQVSRCPCLLGVAILDPLPLALPRLGWSELLLGSQIHAVVAVLTASAGCVADAIGLQQNQSD